MLSSPKFQICTFCLFLAAFDASSFRLFPHCSRFFNITLTLFFIKHNNVQTYLQYALVIFKFLGIFENVFQLFRHFMQGIYYNRAAQRGSAQRVLLDSLISCLFMFEWMWNSLILQVSFLFLVNHTMDPLTLHLSQLNSVDES